MKSVSRDSQVVALVAPEIEAPPAAFPTGSGSIPAFRDPARSVPELIARAFSALPTQPAVEFQGEATSRLDIAKRSDLLAAWLVEHAAGPGCLVGVYMDRSVEMLVGILGVMKAGAAYVPLDPAFPRARNEQILKETKVEVLLTQQRYVDVLPECDAQILSLDGAAGRELELRPWPVASELVPEVLPEMRAYVIFTSGSTGRPKGVEVTHGSVVNLLESAVALLEAGEGDRLVAITTLAFDISVLELLLPLVCGGTVVIASKEEAADALRLKELLKSSRATMLQATPVTFRSLLELGFEAPVGFKMMCGGEAWGWPMAERLLATGGRLWNMYGPTETTVWSSIIEVELEIELEAEAEPGLRRMTFGPPIAATQFYILDEERRPVAPGGPGELWIAGAGVARGYLRRPELTVERFLPNPFAAGGRMYRTGDQVRQLANGAIEFIGRLDQQVKLRGFRIELGEIEATMLEVAGIREAVAMLRRGEETGDFLAAVYVGDENVSAESLRQALRRRLPGYMVPKIFARMQSFPLTPNGKTDRKVLDEAFLEPKTNEPAASEPKASEPAASEAAARRQASRSVRAAEPDDASADAERRMLGIWHELFAGVAAGETIQDGSDFFDLGGDSLLLVRLQSLVAAEFDLRLTMTDLTQHCTFGGLVQWVVDARSGADSAARPLNPGMLQLNGDGSGIPVFLIPQMLVFRTLAEELGKEQPFYALQIMDEEVADELATASFEDLAGLYCTLIREVQPEGPYRLGGWCLWGWVAYEVARQLESQGAEVEMLAIVDAWAPGYWSRYPPVWQFFVNANHFWQRLMWYADSMKSLPVADRVKDGRRRLRELFTDFAMALPQGLRPELPVVDTLRIQKFASKAAETYRPGPVKANVVLFKSELRPTGRLVGEDMGWSAILGREVGLVALPGNHNDIFKLPAARIMASRMREMLGLSSTGSK